MAKKNKKRKGISVISARFTATMSVMLVLLLLGVIALIGMATKSVTTGIRENIGFNIVLVDSIPEHELAAITQHCEQAQYVAQHHYMSAADALEQWREQTGEDIMELLEVNPFRSEIEVKVKADYANPDSLSKITTPIQAMQGVEEISMPSSIIESINRSLHSLMMVLTVIAAALLLISFVLISNTVHLSIYAKRFTIHTMQLVGATDGFIRRPFILSNLVCGVIAGIVADVLLVVALVNVRSLDPEIAAALPWQSTIWVLVATIVAGAVITSVAALLATNKYLHTDYDDMFN